MSTLSPRLRALYALKRYQAHFTRKAFDDSALQQSILEELKDRPSGKRLEIERVKNISRVDFYRNFLLKGKPCIIEGVASKWACVEKWTLDFLEEKYGDDVIPVMDTMAQSSTKTFEVRELFLRDILNAMRTGDMSKYARFNNLLHSHPELIDDLDREYLFSLRNKISSGNSFQIFMGAKGSKTELHAAPAHNLFVQVQGSKHWYLYDSKYDPMLRPNVNGSPYYTTDFDPTAPDFERYPAAKFLDYYEFDLNQGEILYNPSSWWHYVYNNTATIGFGFRWFGALSSPQLNASHCFLTLTAYNPSVFFMMKNKRNYSKVFQKIHEKKKKAS